MIAGILGKLTANMSFGQQITPPFSDTCMVFIHKLIPTAGKTNDMLLSRIDLNLTKAFSLFWVY